MEAIPCRGELLTVQVLFLPHVQLETAMELPHSQRDPTTRTNTGEKGYRTLYLTTN